MKLLNSQKGSQFSQVFFTRTGVGSFDSCNYDPELRAVLELATDSELYELERILFGPRFFFWWHYVLCIFIFLRWYRMLIFFFFWGTKFSYFSPLLKSLTKRGNIDYIVIEEDPQEREEYIALLESRFLYLAADARSTLRFSRYAHHIELVSWNYICSVTEECKDFIYVV